MSKEKTSSWFLGKVEPSHSITQNKVKLNEEIVQNTLKEEQNEQETKEQSSAEQGVSAIEDNK